MKKPVAVALDTIYVPIKLRKTLDPAKVAAVAETVMENGPMREILVRRDKDRYVLVSGLHRLEALRALGETTAMVLIVQARQF